MALISRWKLNDDAASTTVLDSAGSNPGVSQQNTNLLSVFGPIENRAISFNGISDDVIVSDSADYDFSTALSAVSWINPTAVGDNDGIISRYLTAGDKREWAFIITGTSGTEAKLAVLLGNSGGTDISQEITNSVVISNRLWYLVGFTYDAGTIIIYVNAVPIASTTTGTHVLTLNNEAVDLAIGLFNGATYFDGVQDDVRIYDSVLSTSDMKQILKEGAIKMVRGRYDGSGLPKDRIINR